VLAELLIRMYFQGDHAAQPYYAKDTAHPAGAEGWHAAHD